MREKILHELQKKEEDKVMLSFKTEKRYKNIFERVCKHEGYSMSSILNALLKTYVNEFLEEEYKNIRPLMKRADEILEKDRLSKDPNIQTETEKELLEIKDAYIKEYSSIFSISDEGTYIPYEDDIDNLRGSNHADTIYSEIIFYTETDEEYHKRMKMQEKYTEGEI